MKDNELVKTLFSALDIKEPRLITEIFRFSKVEHISKNSQIVKQHQFIKWFVIILKGRIRVWQECNERELTLYKIKKHETCVYSIVAIEKDYQSMVNASTLSDTIILKIPVRFVGEWKKYSSWQEFITTTLIDKYEYLLKAVELLAFKRIDERILTFLTNSSKETNSREIHISHNEIAKEIGTTREVVSKSLKVYERKGILSLKFKKIKLL